MKPGKFSRRSTKKESTKKEWKIKCPRCSSTRCNNGEDCHGRKVECFDCGKKGHFKNAEMCKKKRKPARRTRDRRGETESESESETPTSSSDDTSSSEEQQDDKRDKHSKTHRIYKHIPTVRRVCKTNRTTQSRYKVDIVIREKHLKACADTGADICVMSKRTARKLKLKLQPTSMKIKPYGSRSKKCVGMYIGTIMHGKEIANAHIYVVEENVETLLSGMVCEELNIIKFTATPHVANVTTTPQEKKELLNRFPALFSGVGTLKDYTVRFHIDEGIKPVSQPARPIPFHLREKLEQELKKMEEQNIIEEHTGPAPWISNPVLAPKEDGGVRVTVDMRCANKAIKPTNIPIPRAEEIRAQLSGFTKFSKLDFKSAFHQLELDESSRQLTVFHAGDKLMRYKRLTMGSTPASGELALALRPIFQGCKGVFVIHDDLIVAGKNRQEHDATLQEVCEKIEASGMTLNPDKCIIAADSIPWWGMIISGEGIKPDPSKVEALRHAAPPENKDELCSFLCMIKSNSEFIPDISKKTENLRKMLTKHKTFQWTDQCKEEYNQLKKDFREDTLLRHFDPSKNTYIHVDEHTSGISAILMQGDT